MKFVDRFLNSITMYRLVLYVLIFLVSVSIILSWLKVLPFEPSAIIFSTGFLIAISWLTNTIFATIWEAPTNIESVYITALIAVFLITPKISLDNFFFLFWVGVLSQASKYILAVNKKHIFNPAAIAIVLTTFFANQSASWWVGTAPMFPFVLVTGLLIARKIQREDLMFTFFFTALTIILSLNLIKGVTPLTAIQKALLDSPLLFFAFVMLTEPLTTPPTKKLQIVYGIITGVLYCPQVHFGYFYATPEIALTVGNLYSYLVSPKTKLVLTLKEKIQLTPDTFDFVFNTEKKIKYTPGQYMEWTLPHKSPDSRGNRRYFTLASSPTENELRLGVKFYPNSSSFKIAMQKMNNKTQIVASQIAGDFTLPQSKNKKLVFVAGGIGVTPFRSMLQYLKDTNQTRDIVILYSNKNLDEIAYKTTFDSLSHDLGIKIIYTLTDKDHISNSWTGQIGRIDQKMISREIPDYKERMFFISGPHSFVKASTDTLHDLGLNKSQIVTDFFPGFV